MDADVGFDVGFGFAVDLGLGVGFDWDGVDGPACRASDADWQLSAEKEQSLSGGQQVWLPEFCVHKELQGLSNRLERAA